MRLDRFLSNNTGLSRKEVRQYLAKKLVKVEGEVVTDGSQHINEFTHVELMGEAVQSRRARYFMLHKPKGYLSATKDDQHPTALDLLDEPFKEELHIGGRLDLHTSGLLLITDDGKWSRHVTAPKQKIPKVYLVETADPITPDTADVFAQGVYFKYEDLTTSPAQLEILEERKCRLTIYEGRYHQVKRMFGSVGNRVVELHRESVGQLVLDPKLEPGEYRELSAEEVAPYL